jgi:spermidine synthase
MVEIDKAVVRATKLHLPSLSCKFDNPKLELLIGDGSYLVGPAEGLFTAEFYNNCKRALRTGGLSLLKAKPLIS